MSSLHRNDNSDPTVDTVGRLLARPLTTAADQVTPDIAARLASARARAVACAQEARLAQDQLVTAPAGEAALSGGPTGAGKRWGAALVPALLVLFGLVALAQGQWLQEALGLGDVDTALLKDQLPPNAYGDPGFNEYLDEEDPKARADEAKPEAEQKDEGS